MRDPERVESCVRLAAPLAAVLALLGPAVARAASPAPDASPNGAALAPDPAPTTPHVAAAAAPRPRTPVTHPTSPAAAPRRVVDVVVQTAPTVVTRPTAAISTPRVRHKPKPPARVERAKPARHVQDDPIVDVVPLRVDVHRGLGAIASSVRDDRGLVLAAAALLVAVAAAASGAGLAFFARRPA